MFFASLLNSLTLIYYLFCCADTFGIWLKGLEVCYIKRSLYPFGKPGGLASCWNPVIVNATPVWDKGYMGANSIVAIIDTGVWIGHFMFGYTHFLDGIDLSFDNQTVCDIYMGIPRRGMAI